MLIQHERYEKARTFHKGDPIEVRLSLKQGDERKVIPLPMTVRRVEENGIGAEFLQPQSELMTLLEPYRLDKEETRVAAVSQAGSKTTAAHATSLLSPEASARASRRRFAIQRARAQFAESMKTGDEPVAETEPPARVAPRAKKSVTNRGGRGMFYVGLLSLVTAVGIVLLDFGNHSGTESRLSGLESNLDQQGNALSLLSARLSATDTDTVADELAVLTTRVETLASSFAALETRLLTHTDQTTESSTPATPVLSSDASEPVNDIAAVETHTTSSAVAEPEGISNTGPWVINLVSLDDETAANRFREKALALGVRADTDPVSVNGKQVWRIQVSGFPTREEASAYGDKHKQKLGLNSVWIFKKGQ
jgi:hypothetical protein